MKRMDRAEFEADVRIIAAAFQRARIEDGKEPLSEEENEAAIQRLVEAKYGPNNSQTTCEIKTYECFPDGDPHPLTLEEFKALSIEDKIEEYCKFIVPILQQNGILNEAIDWKLSDLADRGAPEMRLQRVMELFHYIP